MNKPVQSIVHALYAIPLLGRLVRIVVGLARLPELRHEVGLMAYWEPRLRRLEELQASEERQRLEDLRVLQQRLDTLQAHIDAVTARLDALSAQLATIATDHGNLMTSLPVTLRQSARDLESLRARVDAARDPAPASQAR